MADLAGDLEGSWRYVCPEGHHSLSDQLGPTVYCQKCNSAYRDEDIIDKGDTEQDYLW